MSTFTASFKDVYANEFVDAVLEITSATRSTNEDLRGNRSGHLNVSAQYWRNQEAKDNGALPMDLRTAEGHGLHKQLDAEDLDAPLAEVSYAFIMGEVLPSLS